MRLGLGLGLVQPVIRLAGILRLLNVQKLSLPANTAVGTQVAVTDGFVATNTGANSWGASDLVSCDGFFAPAGTFNSKGVWKLVGHPIYWIYAGGSWQVFDTPDDSGNNGGNAAAGTEAFPWLADLAGGNWLNTSVPTLTHPAIQQLTAPSTAQGGVFVSGGTQDGVWVNFDTVNGKERYGYGDYTAGDANSIQWVIALDLGNGPRTGFVIFNGGADALYYSTSAVATPDLATNWKNASDDTPASITVSSVTVGQLVSGWKLGSVVYVVNGNQNGCNIYTDVLGVADPIAVEISFGGTRRWVSGVTTGSGNTALPDIGTADPVASESNWGPIP